MSQLLVFLSASQCKVQAINLEDGGPGPNSFICHSNSSASSEIAFDPTPDLWRRFISESKQRLTFTNAESFHMSKFQLVCRFLVASISGVHTQCGEWSWEGNHAHPSFYNLKNEVSEIRSQLNFLEFMNWLYKHSMFVRRKVAHSSQMCKQYFMSATVFGGIATFFAWWSWRAWLQAARALAQWPSTNMQR